MFPNNNWHADDDSGEHSVAQTTPKQLSRQRKILLGIVVLLGIGVGVIYSSISAPPLKPTPTHIALQPTVTQRQTLAPKATRAPSFQPTLTRQPILRPTFTPEEDIQVADDDLVSHTC